MPGRGLISRRFRPDAPLQLRPDICRRDPAADGRLTTNNPPLSNSLGTGAVFPDFLGSVGGRPRAPHQNKRGTFGTRISLGVIHPLAP